MPVTFFFAVDLLFVANLSLNMCVLLGFLEDSSEALSSGMLLPSILT